MAVPDGRRKLEALTRPRAAASAASRSSWRARRRSSSARRWRRRCSTTSGRPGASLLRLGSARADPGAGLRARRPRRYAPARPAARGRLRRSRSGVMNLAFYEALDRIPLGVAVTIEFVGPVAVAVALSRRPLDLVWIALAVGGHRPAGRPLRRGGIDPRRRWSSSLVAAACWAAYILLAAARRPALPRRRGARAGRWSSPRSIPLVPGRRARAARTSSRPRCSRSALASRCCRSVDPLLAGDRGAAAHARATSSACS